MKRAVYDIAALIVRVVVGVIFVAHGWQKWQSGLGTTSAGFAQMGVPQPQLAAAFSTIGETVGGALLIIGLLVRPAALVLLIGMVGAIMFGHWGKGIFVQEGGWELPAALGSVALLFLALGGGRLGLDGIIHGSYRRRARQRAAEKASAGRPAPGHREDTLPIHRDEQPGYREGTQPGYREEPPNPGGYGDTRSGYQEERPQSGDREDTQPGYREDTGRGPQGETRHTVPRQPSGHRSDALSPEDMRDLDALIGDEHRRPKPPNR
ncbi:DoxX family protein [Nonomuraea glycinis]|uniref:DoxX family protein n=1 Tax=Nonomuraea glycinis TaxID=2047744 RepID=UPI002E0EF9DF|nr:DoxX family membrane protein [Nonomuraea glycinis]